MQRIACASQWPAKRRHLYSVELESAVREEALSVCVEGRDPAAAAALVERRNTVTSPFYTGD